MPLFQARGKQRAVALPGAGKVLESSSRIIAGLAPNPDYYERIRLNTIIEMSIKWFQEILSRYDTPDCLEAETSQ